MSEEATILLDYVEVLEYFSDRAGDSVIVTSHPVTGALVPIQGPDGEDAWLIPQGGATMLGLSVSTIIGGVEAVHLVEEAEWLEGRAGACVTFEGESGQREGLVLTREWFCFGRLSARHTSLTVLVRAVLNAPPMHPFPAQEGNTRDIPDSEYVGWGFTFDFDGSPPFVGRWARGNPAEGEVA